MHVNKDNIVLFSFHLGQHLKERIKASLWLATVEYFCLLLSFHLRFRLAVTGQIISVRCPLNPSFSLYLPGFCPAKISLKSTTLIPVIFLFSINVYTSYVPFEWCTRFWLRLGNVAYLQQPFWCFSCSHVPIVWLTNKIVVASLTTT